MNPDPIEELARAAEAHARQEHGLAIGLDAVDGVDRIGAENADRSQQGWNEHHCPRG